jgi:hypothetical protein
LRGKIVQFAVTCADTKFVSNIDTKTHSGELRFNKGKNSVHFNYLHQAGVSGETGSGHAVWRKSISIGGRDQINGQKTFLDRSRKVKTVFQVTAIVNTRAIINTKDTQARAHRPYGEEKTRCRVDTTMQPDRSEDLTGPRHVI